MLSPLKCWKTLKLYYQNKRLNPKWHGAKAEKSVEMIYEETLSIIIMGNQQVSSYKVIGETSTTILKEGVGFKKLNPKWGTAKPTYFK